MSLWEKKEFKDFHLDLDIPEVFKKIFYLRDFKTNKQINDFLNPSLTDLKDPNCLKGLEKSVKRLIKAFKNKEKIGIYGDFDMDGSSASCLVEESLHKMGFKEVYIRQAKRLKEGYGFHEKYVDEFLSLKVSLIITLDVGITDHKSISSCMEKKMDVILTDHHQVKKDLPKAYSVINPHQASCTSNLTYLSGVGVGFFLMWGLLKKMKEENLVPKETSISSVLDLYTLGTLSDVVPLLKDNRILVKKGLEVLSKTEKKGLKRLKEALNLNLPLQSDDVLLRLIPKINSLSRLGEKILPIDLLSVKDEKTAHFLVEKTLEFDEKRKQIQKKMEEDSLKKLENKKNENFIFVCEDDFHPGLLGINASRLSETFHLPCFVACKKDEFSYVGSSRMPENLDLNLIDLLTEAKDSLVRFGGHKRAAGFEIKKNSLEEFENSLNSYFKKNKKIKKIKKIEYDLQMSLKEIKDPSFLSFYEKLKPFGTGFKAPLFLFKSLSVQKKQILKNDHLKLYLKEGNQFMEALWFFYPKEKDLFKKSLKKVDLLAFIKENEFLGNKRLQMHIKDLKEA